MLQNIQYVTTSILIGVATYHLFMLLNDWYYQYFIEKINKRRTNDFNKQDFKKHSIKFTTLTIVAFCINLMPFLWSLNLIMIIFIAYQMYKVNNLTFTIKKLYGLQK